MGFTDEQMIVLKNTPIFRGLSDNNIESYLNEINCYPRSIFAGSQLVEQGQLGLDIHILLSGSAVGERLLLNGGIVTVNEFYPGDIFGDVLTSNKEESPVSVRMTEDGYVLRIPFLELVSARGDPYLREMILCNLIEEISLKYFALMKRLNILLCPTLRGKIAIYLLAQTKKEGTVFIVPHSREEQARILSCDRSALSRELSKMRREGLIDFSGRRFRISDPKLLEKLAQ